MATVYKGGGGAQDDGERGLRQRYQTPERLLLTMRLLCRHKSIIAYLAANNLANTATVLREELDLGEDVFDAAMTKKYETLLEKKWTSIVRLQKKACPFTLAAQRLPDGCLTGVATPDYGP